MKPSELQAVRFVDLLRPTPSKLSRRPNGFTVEIEFVVLQSGQFLQPTLLFADERGNTLFWSTDTDPELRRTPREKGKYKSSRWRSQLTSSPREKSSSTSEQSYKWPMSL